MTHQVGSRRRRRRSALAVLIAAGTFAVAGCSAHPGVAAVVGDHSIDAETVDQIASSYCAANRLASREEGATGSVQPTRELRRGVLNALIQSRIVQMAAQRLNVEVPDAQVAKAVAAGMATLPRGLDSADQARIKELLSQLSRSQLLMVAIGERLLGEGQSGGQGKSEAFARGRQFVTGYAAKLDIEVDPRYGAYTATGLTVRSGSLSVPVSAQAQQAERRTPDEALAGNLPASQTCG